MSTTPDKLVERYLKHLEIELDDLPRDRRREIVDEIAGHIAEARAGLENETEADVRNILEGLGDPADIAVDARERFDVQSPAAAAAQPYKPGWMEVGALVLLLVGGLILPIVGWVVGVVLLWVSNAWNVRDKVIGTLFVPGGLGLSLFLGVVALSASGSDSSCQPLNVRAQCVQVPGGAPCPEPIASPIVNPCPDGGSTSYLAVIGLILLLVTPIITTAYLAYRLKRRPVLAAT